MFDDRFRFRASPLSLHSDDDGRAFLDGAASANASRMRMKRVGRFRRSLSWSNPGRLLTSAFEMEKLGGGGEEKLMVLWISRVSSGGDDEVSMALPMTSDGYIKCPLHPKSLQLGRRSAL